MDTNSNSAMRGKRQRPLNDSPSKSNKKKKEKGSYFCLSHMYSREYVLKQNKAKMRSFVKAAVTHGCTESVLAFPSLFLPSLTNCTLHMPTLPTLNKEE